TRSTRCRSTASSCARPRSRSSCIRRSRPPGGATRTSSATSPTSSASTRRRSDNEEPLRMVKLFFFCRRRPDLTHERYAELVLRGHVPLALRHHPTLRTYVVNVVEGRRAGAEELDSIGELSFDSLDDFRERLYDSEDGRRVIERDVAGFM